MYKRSQFIKLPAGTIYSRVPYDGMSLMWGLFCKTSDPEEWGNDWVQQDLIREHGYPNGITDGMEALEYQLMLRDSYRHFETDLNCGGRDGMFEDSDRFVVWDKNDIIKLRDYLNDVLEMN